ncbi:MAG: molybdopterin-binding oxidoreductase, partial [Frankiales bacterium]|nr:molybdopterin-binding oxidoreductase [Frankiales bacterium]
VRWLQQRADVGALRAAIGLPVPVRRAPGDLAAADLGVPGVASVLTSNEAFYRIDTALTVPQVDPSGWSLEVGGLVDAPYTLTYADLLALPMVEHDITMSCVSNEIGGDLVGTARWQGVLLRDVLARAGVRPGAEQVVGESVDGFTAGFPVRYATDGRPALVAVAMNGEPLPVEHGFPARLVVPGLYGYVSATKWLTRLTLTTWAAVDGYWVPRGWSKEGPVKTMSRIDVPRGDGDVEAGPVVVAGVAWAPGRGRGVTAVQVRVDRGPWQDADLGGALSEDTWRQWRWTWPATRGEHLLEVRATDRLGDVQTGKVADVAPDGATGYHRLELRVV